jgi:hypothetical protein
VSKRYFEIGFWTLLWNLLLGHSAKMSFYSGILNAKFFSCGVSLGLSRKWGTIQITAYMLYDIQEIESSSAIRESTKSDNLTAFNRQTKFTIRKSVWTTWIYLLSEPASPLPTPLNTSWLARSTMGVRNEGKKWWLI